MDDQNLNNTNIPLQPKPGDVVKPVPVQETVPEKEEPVSVPPQSPAPPISTPVTDQSVQQQPAPQQPVQAIPAQQTPPVQAVPSQSAQQAVPVPEVTQPKLPKSKKSLKKFVFAILFIVFLASAGVGLYIAYSSGAFDSFLDIKSIVQNITNDSTKESSDSEQTVITPTPVEVEDTTSLRFLGQFFGSLNSNASQLEHDLNFGDELNFNGKEL